MSSAETVTVLANSPNLVAAKDITPEAASATADPKLFSGLCPSSSTVASLP